MKACTVAILLFAITFSIYGEDVSDPQAHYLIDYKAGDSVKKFAVDVNGDGIADSFFATLEADPDPTTKISNDQAGGALSWDVYVSNPGGTTFKLGKGVEIGGELTQGAGLDVNPDQMYAGNISEINRYGIATSGVKRSTSENSTIIYAFTWEGDHLKQWKLAEFVAGQVNPIFDKYLKDDKRTHVTLQQIKP